MQPGTPEESRVDRRRGFVHDTNKLIIESMVHEGVASMDTELLNEQVQVERKMFSFSLRENPRGRFLRITEDVGGRRDTIIIPSTGLSHVSDILKRVVEADVKAGPAQVQPE